MNVVVLQGKLSRAPEERQLRESVLATYEVTTRDEEGPAITAPVVWFDPPDTAWQLEAGDDVTVVGEVRRRFFRSNGRTDSRTEVVANTVVPSRRKAQAARAIERAIAELEGE
ncbi:MAG: single-strand DNA-binding protein [Acidimicrobiaceae bacterium]